MIRSRSTGGRVAMSLVVVVEGGREQSGVVMRRQLIGRGVIRRGHDEIVQRLRLVTDWLGLSQGRELLVWMLWSC